MTRDKLVEILKLVEDYGFAFVNNKTGNKNSHITVAYKIPDEKLIETKEEYDQHVANLPPREYFASHHWITLQREKLEAQPTCEGCGNKAYKVFKKTWADKGFETVDSVISICNKCKVVDGEIVSFKDVKDSIDKDHLKEAVDDIVSTIIAEKARQELSKR
jgi:ribosomal protein L37E